MIKTTLFFCLALVLGFHTSTAQTVKLLQDSCHTYSYDGSTGELQGSTRCYIHYNAADLEDTSFYFNTYSGVTSYYRYSYTYNANYLLSNYLLVQGESASGPWDNFLKEDYFYDAQDRNTQYVAHFGNSNGDWVPYFRETFWFDDVTPADSSLYELWSESASAWGNYRRYFNYYYPNAALFKSVEEEWKMTLSNWAPLYQETYTYRPDGKPMILETKRYFGSPSHQVLRDSFIYLPNGKLDTTYTVNTLLPAGTVNLLFKKYHYDPEGNLIEVTTWIKSTQPGAEWRPSNRITYTPGDGVYSTDHATENAENYNPASQMFTPLWSISRQYTPQAGGRVLYREEYRQNAGNGVIYTTSLDSIWYRAETVGATLPQVLPALDCTFSNPVTENSVVICNAPDPNATIELRLINSMGQLVTRARVMPGEAWSLPAHLEQGAYFLNVWQNGKYLGAKKMIAKGN